MKGTIILIGLVGQACAHVAGAAARAASVADDFKKLRLFMV
jgi:hypothetical protein